MRLKSRRLRNISLGILALVSGYGLAGDERGRPKPVFMLTQGRGVDVCEAYLLRLNATEYLDNDPRKGRVKEPEMPGFIDLKSVPLTHEEIKRVLLKVNGFIAYQDQDFYDKQRDHIEHLQNEQSQRQEREHFQYTLKYLQDRINRQSLPIVRYQAPIDIDNDNLPDTLVSNWPESSDFFSLPNSMVTLSLLFDKNLQRLGACRTFSRNHLKIKAFYIMTNAKISI